MSRSGSKTKLSSSGSRCNLGDKGKTKDSEDEGGEVVVADVDRLAWKVLGRSETTDLAGMDETQIARKLAGVLGLSQYEENLSEAALVDYYVATYWFAHEHKFTDVQISTLFTITHTLLNNIKDQHLSLPDNIRQLRGMLAGASQQKCLTPQVARRVVEGVTTGLLQHYRLFQYLFEEQQSEHHIDLSLPVEVPPPHATHCPPPLDEAIPLELYEMCLAPQTTVQDEEHALNMQTEETKTEQLSPVLAKLTQEENEVLMKVPPKELKAVMDSLTSDTLSTYQAEVFTKLQEKEKAFISRLSKLEKSLT